MSAQSGEPGKSEGTNEQVDEQKANKKQTVNAATRYVVLSALTFLSALTIRDLVTTLWEMVVLRCNKAKHCTEEFKRDEFQKLKTNTLLNFLFCFLVIGITLLLAVVWKTTPGAFVLN